MKNKNFLKSLIGIILAAVLCGYLVHNGTFTCVKQISGLSLFILLLLTASSFMLNGLQMHYLLRKQNSVHLTCWDTILLPFTMNLLSYVIPANGGFLYSVYFLKTKYGVDISKGASIGFFIIYIYLAISGIICLSIGLFLLSLQAIFAGIALLLSPWLLRIVNLAAKKIKLRFTWFQKGKQILSDIVESSEKMLHKREIVLFNILFTVLQTVITYLVYWFLAKELKMDISSSIILATVLFLQISSFVRIIPGNMGIEDLFSGGVFLLLGQDGSVGVLLSLLLRAARFLLVIPLGLVHLIIEKKKHTA